MSTSAFDVSVSRGSALRVPVSLKDAEGNGIPLTGVTKLLLSVKADTDPATVKIIEIDHKDFSDPEDDAANGDWYMNVPGADNDETPAVYWYQWTVEGLPSPLSSPHKFPEEPAKYTITPTCDTP